jgi:uncharacterized protein YjbI with pentapeptide repeats
MRQFGVAERQLKGAVPSTANIIVGAGSGLVMSELEPAGDEPAPLVGDTAGIGVDEIAFQVDHTGTVNVNLNGDSLSNVSQVAILDANGRQVLLADSNHPQAQVQLSAGTYVLRLTAALGAIDDITAMVWFGGDAGLANAVDMQTLATGNCLNCNLQGANLSAFDLRGDNLAGADLRGAIMVQVPGGFKLSGTDIMTIYLSSSDVQGANLTGANLIGARLSGAYLTGAGRSPARLGGVDLSAAIATDLHLPHADLHGANLSGTDLSRGDMDYAVLRGANLANAILVDADLAGADFTGANLMGTNFTGANLSGAIWADRRVCATPSVGACL